MQCQKFPIIVTSLTILLFAPVSMTIEFERVGNDLKLSCKQGDLVLEGGEMNGVRTLMLTDFVSGNYHCKGDTAEETKFLLYFEPCKDCVAVSIGGICGILIASVMFTIFIGIAVYSISVQDRSWSHQASDRHPLMRNDANDAVYSHLNNDGRSMYSELGKKRRQ
ncbi:T-cell surface glycoprotein CD3 gamma chain-like isoform X3 [Heterodontus francisci]|uniref:T-cell surface glycoprotein CD3 gamma chain-like isoform X3 n=1 Tax=Heterodontus francisci TaxID=7792 RepID=UPI00355BB1F2